jgi:hypothetical protein
MRTLARCLLFFTFSVHIGVMNASARPLSATADNSKLVGRQPTGSFYLTLARPSMLLVGGGLVVFGGILRRRKRAQASHVLED